MRRIVAAAALGGYVLILLEVTLVRYPQPGPPPNWLPLATIGHYLHVGGWELVRNLLGNVVLFVPLGLLFPALHNELRSVRLITVFSLAVSVAIELLQLYSGQRVADVDDVLLNTLGGSLGFALFAVCDRTWQAYGARQAIAAPNTLSVRPAIAGAKSRRHSHEVAPVDSR